MAGDDNYCLRLNRFEENAKIYWQDLQMENDFFDVTLACEEKQIKTHKLIISSCSPVLRNILKTNQTPHPVIYLRRVKYRDLQNLLNFMYQGEVDVAEEDLSSFLEIAEDLNVRGLCERNTEVNPSNEEATSQVTNQKINSSSKRKRIENERVRNINDSNGDSLEDINSNNGDSLENIDYNNGDSFLINDIDTKTLISPRKNLSGVSNPVCTENNKQNVISTVAVQDAGRSHQCGQCDYNTKYKSDLTKHIKGIHVGERYPCAQCSYKATDKSGLAKYVKSIHEGVRYPCDQCNYKATQKINLAQHEKLVHAGVCYPCDQCDYKASRTDRLRSHQLKYHIR